MQKMTQLEHEKDQNKSVHQIIYQPTIEASNKYLAPGFVDTHIPHKAGGGRRAGFVAPKIDDKSYSALFLRKFGNKTIFLMYDYVESLHKVF